MTLKDIFTFLLIMGISYLIGSFNALSFNPVLWDNLGRAMFSIMGSLVAVIFTIILKFRREE
jgi:hypothetical protein